MSRAGSWLLAGLAGLALSGCLRGEPPTDPTAFSYHTRPDAHAQRRVVVVPLYAGPGVGASVARLDAALATALRETNLYEVAVLTAGDRDLAFPVPGLGLDNLTPDNLRQFRDRHGNDAILVGRVDHFDSYDPIAIGLEVHLVSCRDGETVWSASGHFDGRREDVQADIRLWHRQTVGDGQPSIGGWQTVLQSPSLFSRYVADRLSATLLAPPAP